MKDRPATMNATDHAISDREESGSSNESELPPEPKLSLTCDVESDDCDEGWLCRQVEAACPHLPRDVGRLAVRIVGDAEMTDLHRRFHDDPTTTDVLTFDAGAAEGPIEVDIAVCLDEARRNASERGHDVDRELLLYIVHGLLHCCGHDDHEDEAHARMHAEEDRILTAIGVGPVYGGEA